MTKYFDHIITLSFGLIIIFGIEFVFSASLNEEVKLGFEKYEMILNHLNGLIFALLVCIFISYLRLNVLYIISKIACIALIPLLVLTPIIGIEINGAKRWIYIIFFNFQPIEILKPFLIFLCGFLMSKKNNINSYDILKAIGIIIITILSLAMQPDLGHAILIMNAFILQCISSKMISIKHMIFIFIFALAIGMIYIKNTYILKRIVDFFVNGGSWHVKVAVQYFIDGGFFGRGIYSESNIADLPYSYNDFIFAIVASEYGMVYCITIMACFLVGSIRAIYIAKQSKYEENFIACIGLISLIFFQAMMHIMSCIGLIPTKGINLPFAGYGSSSMLSSCISLGIVISITRFINYENKKNSNNLRRNWRSYISFDGIDKSIRRIWINTNNRNN